MGTNINLNWPEKSDGFAEINIKPDSGQSYRTGMGLALFIYLFILPSLDGF